MAAVLENFLKREASMEKGRPKGRLMQRLRGKVMVALIQVVEGRYKNWLDSEYMLWVESTGFADYLDV